MLTRIIHVLCTDGSGVVGAVRALAREQAAQGLDPVLVMPRLGSIWNTFKTIRNARMSRTVAPFIHVHGLWSPVAGAVMWYARASGIPYCVSPHGMLMPEALRLKEWKKRPYWSLVERRQMEGARFLHVTSELEAVSARRRLPTVPLHIIPNGVDIPVRNDWGRFDVPGAEKYFLFLGRLHPIKNLGSLIQAARTLPTGWVLAVAGGGSGSYERTIRTLARREAAGKVHFLGWLDGLAKWCAVRSAVALVLPSKSENFGNVVAESLSMGTPVIASTGTPWQILEREGAGLWVPPTVEDLAKAMQVAWQSEETWTRMRANALALARRFSWPLLAAEFVSAYGSDRNHCSRPPS